MLIAGQARELSTFFLVLLGIPRGEHGLAARAEYGGKRGHIILFGSVDQGLCGRFGRIESLGRLRHSNYRKPDHQGSERDGKSSHIHLLTSSAATAAGPSATEASATEGSSGSEARKAMVALLAGFAATLNPAERAMVRTGTPLLKPAAPVFKTAAIRSSERLFPRRGISLSAKSFAAAGAPVMVRHRPIGIRDAQSMRGIVRPGATALKAAAMKVTVTIAMEEKVIHINPAAKPIRPPPPTAPSEAAEKAPDVNAPAEPPPNTDSRVKERRIKAI